MPVYEKADFLAAYSSYAVDPVTRHRFAKFRSPALEGLTGYDSVNGVTCQLHYHPNVLKPKKVILAQRLVDYFIAQSVPLTASDRLVIIGGAFGWLGEALEDLIPGIEAVSVDMSQYVQDTKDFSPDDELIEDLVAKGYDHNLANSVGEFLHQKFSDPNPRSRNGAKVLQEDLATQKSRNEVRKVLQQADPTRVITEEVWQILTQTEKDLYTAAAAAWGVSLTHIVEGIVS